MSLVPVNRVGVAGHAGIVHQVTAGQAGVMVRKFVADAQVVEIRGTGSAGLSRWRSLLRLPAGLSFVVGGGCAYAGEVDVVHHRLCTAAMVLIDVGGDTDDGGVEVWTRSLAVSVNVLSR